MGYLQYLPLICVMIFFGFLVKLFAKKAKLPWVILLILLGAAFANISIGGVAFYIPPEFLIGFTLFVLIIVVFNDISTITTHEFTEYSKSALRLTTISKIINMMFLSFFSYLIFGFSEPLLNFLLVFAVSNTDITSLMFMFKENKAIETLKFEALFSTPISLLGSLVIIGAMQFSPGISFGLAGFIPFIKKIFFGIGAGAILSILTFSMMSKYHHKHISRFLLISLAIAAYFLGEFIGGYGIFAIAVYALVFEKSFLEKKDELRHFSKKLSDFFSVVAFMLLGYIMPTGLTPLVLLKAVGFFIVYLVLRLASVFLALHGEFKTKEIFFIALTVPKGLTACALTLFLSVLLFIPVGFSDIVAVFLLLSIILSCIMALSSHYLFKKEIEE